MRRAFLGGCLVAAICVASVLGQQPDDFGKKGFKGGGGGRGKNFQAGSKVDVSSPHRWEYAVRKPADLQEIGGGDLQRGMNRMGEMGWELVAVDGIFGQGLGHAYFKRPRSGPPQPVEEEALGDQPLSPPIPPGSFGGLGGFGKTGVRGAPPQKETTVVISLKNSQSMELAQILTSLFRTSRARFVPDSRTNRLVLVAPDDKLAEIRKLIEELDQPAAPDRRFAK